jgi:hypothetical protein
MAHCPRKLSWTAPSCSATTRTLRGEVILFCEWPFEQTDPHRHSGVRREQRPRVNGHQVRWRMKACGDPQRRPDRAFYVLEGSLRKSGNRIRVGTQLVECETGKHVWAERYDRDLADIFALQDEITEAVTIALVPAIADAEQHRALRKPPGSLDA